MENILRLLASFRPSGRCENLTPCLVGETGTGKTSRVYKLAAELGLPVRQLLLQTQMPEEILGIPKAASGRGGRRTVWHPAEWLVEASRRPVVLFLDELDKPRQENRSALLTLLAERAVNGVVLHPQTVIIAAMQPVERDEWLCDETGKALSARLIFLPVREAEAWRGLETRFGIDLSWYECAKPPVAPVLDRPSPRQVAWALEFLRFDHGLSADEVNTVLLGLFHASFAERLLRSVNETPKVTTELLVRNVWNRNPKSVLDAALADVIQAAADIFLYGTPATYTAALWRVWLHGSNDERRAYGRSLIETLQQRYGVGVTIDAPFTEEDCDQRALGANFVAAVLGYHITDGKVDLSRVIRPDWADFLPVPSSPEKLEF